MKVENYFSKFFNFRHLLNSPHIYLQSDNFGHRQENGNPILIGQPTDTWSNYRFSACLNINFWMGKNKKIWLN